VATEKPPPHAGDSPFTGVGGRASQGDARLKTPILFPQVTDIQGIFHPELAIMWPDAVSLKWLSREDVGNGN
jgi:hypothetical protein